MRKTALLAGATLWLATLSAAAALDDEPPPLSVLVASSDLIVVGKIVRTTQVERDNDLMEDSFNKSSRFTAVIATIEVNETIKGDAPQTVKMVFPKRSRVKGEPVYDFGQDGVWLLRRSEKKENEFVADEIGRYQRRERKEQIKAIFALQRTNKGSDKEPPPDGTTE